MSRPRCGVPDMPVPQGAPRFVAQGNRWAGPNVSYTFSNFSPDLTTAQARAALRGAFDRWSAVTQLNFIENPAGGDVRIGWYSGNHGDGAANAFDGISGRLAHCFYPPPNGGDIAGDCHFDEAETWSVSTPPTGTDLPTVALHELGHGLGLDHSEDTSAVMYAYYGGPRRELTADDITGIQSIYGARFRWASRGGAIFDPVVATNADGRLEVFARGTDGALWHIWQKAPNSTWSSWASLGGWIVNPVVASNADGRMEVFAQGADGALWHIWQTKPNNGWSGWASLGGVLSSPVAVGRNKSGRLEVFVRGTDGALWHIWQKPQISAWAGWASLGGVIVGGPVIAANADGRLEAFVRGTDNALWHIWQKTPDGTWSGWATLGGIIADPSVGQNADGRLEVFVRGADKALWHIWQTKPNNGWGGWVTLSGQLIGGPVASRNQDGRMEVFVKGTDNALWHTWQTKPNNGWT
jgi:acylphosphatase